MSKDNKDFTFPEIIWKVSVRQSVRLKTSSDFNDFFKSFYEGITNCRIFYHGTFVLRSANVDGWPPLVFWLLVVWWRVPSYWGFAARRSLFARYKISDEIRRLCNERSRQGWPKSPIDNSVGHIFHGQKKSRSWWRSLPRSHVRGLRVCDSDRNGRGVPIYKTRINHPWKVSNK